MHGLLKHMKGSNNGNQRSSSVINGKRGAYGNLTGGDRVVDPSDDLFIRLLAQKALADSQNTHILNQDEVEDLKNVCIFPSTLLKLGTIIIEIDD
jgi:hypothetical protein